MTKKTKIEKPSANLAHSLQKSMQKEFGMESIINMNDKTVDKTKSAFSYGWPELDDISGIGGVPRGRIVEVYGPPSSGKTTLCLHMAKECQSVGGVVCYIDVENALDPDYCETLGVNVEDWLLIQPDHGEQAFSMIQKLIIKKKIEESKGEGANVPLLTIVDSVAALASEVEIANLLKPDEQRKGAGLAHTARLMSDGLRQLNAVMKQTNSTIVFINQVRNKVGVVYGSNMTTPGGNSLKFYASVRIQLSSAQLKQGDTIVGNTVTAKLVKNKLAPPFKTCSGTLRFGQGLDKIYSLFRTLEDRKIFKKAGSWYSTPSLPDLKKFQGYNGFRELYDQNPKMFQDLLDKKIV